MLASREFLPYFMATGGAAGAGLGYRTGVAQNAMSGEVITHPEGFFGIDSGGSEPDADPWPAAGAC